MAPLYSDALYAWEILKSRLPTFSQSNCASLPSVCNSNSSKSVIVRSGMRVSMRCVVNNAELQRNETPLDRSTFTSFRSTSPSSGWEFLFRLFFSLPYGEIVHRSRAAPASLYRCTTVFRVHPPPFLPSSCPIAYLFTHRWRHKEISEMPGIHFHRDREKRDRFYPVVRTFGSRVLRRGSSS